MDKRFRSMFIAWRQPLLSTRRTAHSKCNQHIAYMLYTSFFLKVTFSLNRYYRHSAV